MVKLTVDYDDEAKVWVVKPGPVNRVTDTLVDPSTAPIPAFY